MVIEFNFQKIEKKHLIDVARIHYEELNTGILSLLGKSFLYKYYNQMTKSNGWGYVVTRRDKVAGYIYSESKDLNKIALIALPDIMILIKNLFLKPKMIINILLSMMFSKFYGATITTDRVSIISQFAVSKVFQSQGYGKELIHRFEEEAIRRGCNYVSTSTHNFDLRNFYISTKDIKKEVVVPNIGYKNYIISWKL